MQVSLLVLSDHVIHLCIFFFFFEGGGVKGGTGWGREKGQSV